MDKNVPPSYKSPTLFMNESGFVLPSDMRAKMSEDLIHQINHIDEYISFDKKLDDEVLICECFCVNVRDIRETCSDFEKVDLSLLQNKLSLGHGCQSCLKRIDYWVDKIF